MEKLYLKRSWRIGTCLMVLLTFFALSLSAQNRKVTGVVVDEFGDPLPGANITVVGNQNLATATNMEGQFTLNNVPKDAILNVRFIGYAVKTIRLATLKNNDLLRIVLSEDVKELNDVVVTALGISRESKSLGYARQSIDTESLLDTRDPNLLNSLSGKVSGVNFISNGGPLSSTRVEIRGNNSLTGNNQPLYVIDGVPIMNPMGEDGDLDYGNPASAISPDDIESIEVLKGANAAALYGSDAANGVILITTRKATKKSGLGVSYGYNMQFTFLREFPAYQNVYGSASLPAVGVRERVLGYGEYPDDVEMEGMVYASAVRSQYPRARVLDIDCGKAAALPGVLAVLTAEDVPNNKVGHLQQDWDVMIAKGDITRCVGDAICLVVAESRDILEKAKRMVKIDYEELKPVCSIQEAMAEDAAEKIKEFTEE